MTETKLKKVTFRRDRWVTGALSRPQYRLNAFDEVHDNAFCALGFYMNQIGFAPEQLYRRACPAGVVGDLQREAQRSVRMNPEEARKAKEEAAALFAQKLTDAGAEWLVCPHTSTDGTTEFSLSPDADSIVDLNDKVAPNREQRIKDLFAKHGVEVEFK